MAEHFPREPFEALVYEVAVHGQKTYNGVAILSRLPLEEVVCGFAGDPNPAQSRYIQALATLPGTGLVLRVASVYVPNGRDASHGDFVYKQRFFEALSRHMMACHAWEEMMVVGGDYNVAPDREDAHPLYQTDACIGTTLRERHWFDVLLQQGWVDGWAAYAGAQSLRGGCANALRTFQPSTDACIEAVGASTKEIEGAGWTWWDYRQRSWQHNRGMRIDHLLLSYEAADAMMKVEVDRAVRAGERPSDHVPVMLHMRVPGRSRTGRHHDQRG